MSFDSLETFTLNSSGTLSTWMTEDDNFVSMTFDCKKAFVGEEAYVLIKFKNVGGEGRFFIMSEADWFSMNIIDITDKNSLKLSCFTVWPAYFALNTNEELDFHMYFSPECYGIHVEKLYILCDNCTLLETEIIGDGLIYESNFIQLSKHLMKLIPLERNIDNQANYYINLSTNTPDGIGQYIIAVSNISEISMHFSWMKRNVQTDMHRIHTKNYFPLELLHINPDQGVFAPTSVHYFTVTAEYKDLQPNHYFAVLQLYVEDIPVDAIPKNTDLQTKECTTKRRKCPASVDIWIADVEVWLQYMMDEEDKTDRTTEEILKHILDVPSDIKYPRSDYEEEEEDKEEIIGEILEEEFEEGTSTCQLGADELFYHHDLINLNQFDLLWQEHIISMGIIRPTRLVILR
ncbi:deleted in lung and esophageal cancer protein 1-like isoform X4 [Bombus flavifrons]